MAVTFSFEKTSSPVFGTIYRPVAQVFFYSANRNRWYETWMIVDTGADYTILPRYLAERLGVNLKRDCKIIRTRGIGGEAKVFLAKKLKAKIGKWERIVPVGFIDRDEIPPLLGRHLFMETFDILFSSNHTLTLESA